MSKYFDGDKLDYIALPDTNAGINITTTAPVIISSGSRYTQILDENSEFKKQTDSTIKYYSECLECKNKDERIKELELEIKKLKQKVGSKKMKKVILNKCYGGFRVSGYAYQEYAKAKGIEIYKYTTKDYKNYTLTNNMESEFFSDIYSTKYLGETCTSIPKGCSLWLDTEYREDKILIKVVEKLGEKANVSYSNLVVVEIPEDLDYVIEDYDGFETLHQKVKEW